LKQARAAQPHGEQLAGLTPRERDLLAPIATGGRRRQW